MSPMLPRVVLAVCLLALVLAPGGASALVRPLVAEAPLQLSVGAAPAVFAPGTSGATSVSAGGALATTTLSTVVRASHVLHIRGGADQPQLVQLRVLHVEGPEHLRRGSVSVGGIAQLAMVEGVLVASAAPAHLPSGGTLGVETTLTQHPTRTTTLTLGVDVRAVAGGPVATQTWTLVLT